MKKIFIGILQVILYCIIYELTVWIVYGLCSILLAVLGNIPMLTVIFTNSVVEGITFTSCPLISALVIVIIMGFVFKRTKLYIIPTIIMIAILFYTNISNIIYTANHYGMVSWNFANVVWSSIILCGIITLGLFRLTNYKISKETETY